eukprot:709442-Pelagomonas_calceolata.AAC.1
MVQVLPFWHSCSALTADTLANACVPICTNANKCFLTGRGCCFHLAWHPAASCCTCCQGPGLSEGQGRVSAGNTTQDYN